MKKSFLLLSLISFFVFVPQVSAHPGRTASDGCHYCRTNCAKWGEVEGARHCHGGSTAPAPVKTYTPAPTTYVAPATPKPTPLPTPIPTPKPTVIPTPTPSPTPTPTPTPTPEATTNPEVLGAMQEEVNKDSESSDETDTITTLGTLGLLGAGIHLTTRNSKKKEE